MQNAVNQNRRNGSEFSYSYSVTYSCFGNNPTNGLVTE